MASFNFPRTQTSGMDVLSFCPDLADPGCNFWWYVKAGHFLARCPVESGSAPSASATTPRPSCGLSAERCPTVVSLSRSSDEIWMSVSHEVCINMEFRRLVFGFGDCFSGIFEKCFVTYFWPIHSGSG